MRARILLVCANPRGADPLRTSEEDRTLRESVRLSPNREQIEIETLNAATIDDLRRALLRTQFDVVHFSGHGTKSGLVFEDSSGKLMVPSSAALAELLERRRVKIVLLNACYSLSVGKITSMGLDYTIASTGPIADPAAIEFTRGFYDALGAGTSVPDAYQEGISTVKLKGLTIDSILLARGEEHAPSLKSGQDTPQAASEVSGSPRTLLGIALDTSGSMTSSIQNRSAGNLTRFEGVKEALAEVGAQVQEELATRVAPDVFSVFIYAFGLRIGNGVSDMVSLWRAAQQTDLEKEIGARRHQYEAEARRQAASYGGLASLARSYGFGSLVDSLTEAAKDSVREKIVGEIAGQVLKTAEQLGDSTLSAAELANVFQPASSGFDARVLEHVVFGLTPMTKAAEEIRARFQRLTSNEYSQRTLLVISDGEPTDGSPQKIFNEIRESGIDVVTCFVTDVDIADPRTLIGAPQPSWSSGARLMWEIASELDEASPITSYLLDQGWFIEPGAKLFVQVNHSDVLKEFVRVAASHFGKETAELLPRGR